LKAKSFSPIATSGKELCDVTFGNIRNSMVDHLAHFFYACKISITNSGLENFLNGSSVFSFYGQSARDPHEVCQIHHNFFAVLCLCWVKVVTKK
jgi:hypothetical protein